MKHLKLFFALFAMLALNVGNAWGEEVTYVFTSKDWAAKIGSTAADWTSNKAGAGFSNNGIQVTTNATGANGTSPISYNNISQIVVTYNTNTSKGKGTLSVKIGDNAVTTNNWQYSGSANGTSANFTSTFDYSSPQSGKVTLTANTTTNSIYVVSIKIVTSAGTEPPTPAKTYDVTWMVNGSEWDKTEDVEENTQITTLPEEPTDECADKEFQGWTDKEITDGEKPAILFKDKSPAITKEGTTFYAVFAKKEAGEGNVFDGTTGGTFKIYAQVGEDKKYLAGTGSKITPVEEAEATEYTFTKIEDGIFSIKTEDTYITYVSSTNLGTSNNAYEWKINAGTKGSWRIESNTTSGRGIVYRAGTTNKFGGYATSNVSENGTEYYDVEIGAESATSYSDYTTNCASGIEYVELGDAFKWSAASAEVTIDATDNVFPTLTNTHNVPVKYSSSDETIASIASDGNVTLNKEGTVTITAKYEGGASAGTDKEYKAKTVTYSLKVNKAVAQPTGTMYVKVTDAVTDGEYLIVYEDASNATPAPVAFNGALATEKLDVVSNNIEVSIASNTIAGNTDIDAATFTINTTVGTIQTKDGYYIGQTSNANGLATSTTPEHTNTISIENDGSATIISSGGAYLRYNSNENNWRFRYFKSSTYTAQKAIALYKKVDPNAVVEPVFTPVAGEYYGTQSVTISCATAGAEVYYTLDGTDPTSASTKYTGAISIASTTTVKAIAIKGANSSEVVSATYTILAPLSTMDEIFEKATEIGKDATQSVQITMGGWVVTGIKNSNVYVTDGTKGFIIYTSDHGFVVGNVLSGTVACDLTLYYGSAEVVGLTSTTAGLSVATGGTITPVELDEAAIAALTGINTGSVIKINGVCETANTIAGVKLYNTLFAFEDLELGQEYNVTGVYLQYNTTPEILPRSAADIEEVVGIPTATISIDDITMEVGSEKTIEASITPDAAAATVTYAITSGSDYIKLTNNKITAEAEGTAIITATVAEVTGTYYGATKEFTVTVTPLNIATLPFMYDGNGTDASDVIGITADGVGDYNSTPKIKFDTQDDYLIIHFDSEPGEFSFVLKQNGSSVGGFTVYESEDGETYNSIWTGGDLGGSGKSATIEPTLSATARYVKFVHTNKVSGTNYALGSISIQKADHRQEAELAWNPATVSLTVGDDFTAPTFSNPNSVSGITFASSNEALATVTNAGEISLKGGITGKAVITANFAGNEDYKSAKVTTTIIVSPETGDVVILAKHQGQWYAMKAEYVTDKTDRLAAVAVNYVGGKLYNVSEEDKAAITWTRSVYGDKVSFQNDGKYLKGKTSTTLILEANEDGLYQWNADDNTMLIGETSRTFIYHKDGMFRNYDVQWASPTSETYSDFPVVTAPVYATGDAYGRTVTTGEYGTICIPYGSSNYTGAEFYEVSSVEVGKGLWLDQLAAGAALKAGKPYIFRATASEIAILGDGNTAIDPQTGANGLTGTFIDIAADGILVDNYIIAENNIWIAGTGATLPAYRAYINAEVVPTTAQPQLPGRRRVCMGENAATGFENIVAPEGKAIKVIENNQLIIIRDGVKYNVQGQKL